MSSSTSAHSPDSDNRRSHFTRGEKCIFIHLIITFSLILLLIFIYFIHLCVVSHSLRDVWKITRRTKVENQDTNLGNYPVGYVYLRSLPVQLLCNSILLRPRWSVGPAHCVAMRTDPDMASLLLSWRIRYANRDRKFDESKVKRTIPHPHFDRDDFRNNVGLFEHETSIDIKHFVFPNGGSGINELSLRDANTLALLGWKINSSIHEDEHLELVRYEVQPVATDKCVRFMKPILELRNYEYCFVLQRRLDDIHPDHGSVLVVGPTIMGFFGWGEKTGNGVPCIILDLQYFKIWLENIIAW